MIPIRRRLTLTRNMFHEDLLDRQRQEIPASDGGRDSFEGELKPYSTWLSLALYRCMVPIRRLLSVARKEDVS